MLLEDNTLALANLVKLDLFSYLFPSSTSLIIWDSANHGG